MPTHKRHNRTKQTHPKNSALRPLQIAYERFLKIRGTPREIALGFSLGLFVGMSPVMGLHTAVAVFIAALLKWNKLSAAVGVWITNPFTAPLVYPLCYYVGANILGSSRIYGDAPYISLDRLLQMLLSAPEIFWVLTVGGVALGIPLAVAGYYLSFFLVRRYQENIRMKISVAKEKVAQKKQARKLKRSSPDTVQQKTGRDDPKSEHAKQTRSGAS